MPCRSYDDEVTYGPAGSNETRAKLDMLARIACRALTALEEIADGAGIASTIDNVLTDKEVLDWWPAHKAADAAEKRRKEAAAKKSREAKKRRDVALAKLTPEDRKALGLK